MPYINQIQTQLPAFKYSQENIATFLGTIHPLVAPEVISRVLDNSKIAYRHSVLPDFDDQHQTKKLYLSNQKSPSTIEQRMAIYKEQAFNLALNALHKLDFNKAGITHLITVSCTGLVAPGIDIQLIESLELSPNVERHNVNFMGCFAAFSALKLANTICKAHHNAQILVVCVELCTLHMQEGNELDHVISNGLFADGCAAALITNEPKGLQLQHHFQTIIPESTAEMSWHLGSGGFLMHLSKYVPQFIEKFGQTLLPLIAEHKIDGHAVHPGGRKILQAYTEALKLDAQDLDISYNILKDYGNMSSPTILFVLKEMMDKKKAKSILATGFGPGLTVEGLVLSQNI
jgi:alpha-pyrone synthase